MTPHRKQEPVTYGKAVCVPRKAPSALGDCFHQSACPAPGNATENMVEITLYLASKNKIYYLFLSTKIVQCCSKILKSGFLECSLPAFRSPPPQDPLPPASSECTPGCLLPRLTSLAPSRPSPPPAEPFDAWFVFLSLSHKDDPEQGSLPIFHFAILIIKKKK